MEWQHSRCPMCGNDFIHTKVYTPKTCGQYECIHKYYDTGGEEQALKESWYFRQLNNLCPNRTFTKTKRN